MPSRVPLRCLASVSLVAVLGATPAGSFEFGTGFDLIQDPQTEIEGLHRFHVGREIAPGLSFGQSIYSAASGDAGGAFFWGFEMVRSVPLSGALSLNLSGFVGGGGGAAQVVGDGFMTRANVALNYAVTPKLGAELGASWIKIAGAEIDDPALNFGLTYGLGQGGAAEPLPLRGVSIRATGLATSGTNRNGAAQADMALAGAEVAFALGPMTELTLAGDGAADGAEGYMQVLGGLRQRVQLGPVTGFAEGAIGFGGGGLVDTGAGPMVSAGAGISVPLTQWADLDLMLGATTAPDGDFSAKTAQVRLTRVFQREARATTPGPQKWAYSFGISMQDAGSDFRKPGAPGAGNPIMQESSADMFLGERLYLTGNAQTALGGEVAGYAIGMLGLGYEMPLSDRWTLSAEAHLGAAGGGGVNTAGGPVGSLRAELDYAIHDDLRLSMGLGQIRALKDGGFSAPVAQVGLKLPFETR